MTMLAIDIGNTNVVGAVFLDDNMHDSVRMPSDRNFWSSLAKLSQYSPEGIIISSVVPELSEIYEEACKNMFGITPEFVSVENSGVTTIVDNPVEIGADRLCNIAATVDQYTLPAIVVDFGTATTYDVINELGQFIGGAIAPGIDVSARYLFESASLLRDTALTFPQNAIALTTETNLQSGIMFGAVDEVQGMIKRICDELNRQNVKVILTGGFSTVIAPGLTVDHIINKELTLRGMKLIYEKIRRNNHE